MNGYRYRCVVSNSAGSDTSASATLTVNAVGNPISNFPYSEGFEADLGAWAASIGNDFDWRQNSGSTGSSGTGPSGAAVGSGYAYTEASNPNFPAKTAAMEATFDFSNLAAPELTFSYHMFGAAMGTLSVDVFAEGAWNMGVESISGQQQTSESDAWTSQSVDLSAYGGLNPVVIRVRGVTGTSFTSDMAIDEVKVGEAPGPVPFHEWIDRPDDRRGPDDDAAGDGVPNLIKYFRGLTEWRPVLPPACGNWSDRLRPVCGRGSSEESWLIARFRVMSGGVPTLSVGMTAGLRRVD
jgi:hypothetical protein